MGNREFTPIAMLLTAFALGFSIGGSGFVLAQDTPVVEVAHPAHIHAGTCDSLGDVVFPLARIIHKRLGRAASSCHHGSLG